MLDDEINGVIRDGIVIIECGNRLYKKGLIKVLSIFIIATCRGEQIDIILTHTVKKYVSALSLSSDRQRSKCAQRCGSISV